MSLSKFFLLTLLAVFNLLVLATRAQAQKAVENWLVTVEPDRFSDTATNVLAMTSDELGSILAVRGLSGDLSVALGGEKYRTGDIFTIRVRADKRAVIDTTAIAISEAVMQVDTSEDMIREMLTAKEYAFRVSGNVNYDIVFRAGPGAAEALGEVTKACPQE